jgi:hypothetical protein
MIARAWLGVALVVVVVAAGCLGFTPPGPPATATTEHPPESPTPTHPAEPTTTLTDPTSTSADPPTTRGTTEEPSEHPGPPAIVLEMANQTGDGTTLNINTVTASVDYTIVISANGVVLNRTDVSADETVSDTLTLSPPLTETTMVTVTLKVSTLAEPVTDRITYTVAEEPPDTPTETPTEELASPTTESALMQQYNRTKIVARRSLER